VGLLLSSLVIGLKIMGRLLSQKGVHVAGDLSSSLYTSVEGEDCQAADPAMMMMPMGVKR
jgi:hypothetical protein